MEIIKKIDENIYLLSLYPNKIDFKIENKPEEKFSKVLFKYNGNEIVEFFEKPESELNKFKDKVIKKYNEDKEEIKHIHIDGKKYIKELHEKKYFGLINELFANYICKKLNLPFIEYSFDRDDNDKPFVYSYNFLDDDEEFISGNEYLNPDIKYEEFKNKISKIVTNPELIDATFIVDILMNNNDRNFSNIGIIFNKKNKTYKICPLFDFDESLTKDDDNIFKLLEEWIKKTNAFLRIENKKLPLERLMGFEKEYERLCINNLKQEEIDYEELKKRKSKLKNNLKLLILLNT